MLLQIKHSGQLCNRLFALLPTMSFAIHNKVKLYVLFANQQYMDYFPNIYNSPWIKFLFSKDADNHSCLERKTKWLSDNPKKNIGTKTERALLRLADNPKYAVEGELKDVRRLKGLSCIDGWAHRYDLSFIEEERDNILYLLKPGEVVIRHVNKFFEKYDGITVGMHIRRGDYKEHLGGKYYFEDETYLTVMQKIKNDLLHMGKKKTRFLICSNEPFPINHNAIDMFQICPLHPSDCMTDLYALSRCDYIIGPPSTFSQWASFMGNTPLNVFFGKEDDVKLRDFSPIVLLDKFANNTGYYDRMG